MICRGPRITSHSSSGASCVARGHSRRPRRVGLSECLLEADATDLDLELTTHLAVSLIIDARDLDVEARAEQLEIATKHLLHVDHIRIRFVAFACVGRVELPERASRQ